MAAKSIYLSDPFPRQDGIKKRTRKKEKKNRRHQTREEKNSIYVWCQQSYRSRVCPTFPPPGVREFVPPVYIYIYFFFSVYNLCFFVVLLLIFTTFYCIIDMLLVCFVITCWSSWTCFFKSQFSMVNSAFLSITLQSWSSCNVIYFVYIHSHC